jgi:hypothetical protein
MGDILGNSRRMTGKTCGDIALNFQAAVAIVHDKGFFRIRHEEELRVSMLRESSFGLDESKFLCPSEGDGFGLSYICLQAEQIFTSVGLVCMSLLKFLFSALPRGRSYRLAARMQTWKMADKLLTLFIFSSIFLKIYKNRRSGDSLCRNGVVVNESVQGGGMEGRVVLNVWHAFVLVCMLWPFSAMAENSYVGTAACKDCHEEQYENFTKYAKKSHSDRSVKMMASDLTDAELATCYGCHATGFGKPGGFVSYEKTPHLADAGCEVCHGPGYDHAESGGDAELIKGTLTMEDCVGCHNEDRVKSFNFKPLLYGGAH